MAATWLMSARPQRVRRAFSRYVMKTNPLGPSPCRELMLISKGLLMLLNDVMSHVVLLRSILITRISSSRRNDSRISINFILLVASRGEANRGRVEDSLLPKLNMLNLP